MSCKEELSGGLARWVPRSEGSSCSGGQRAGSGNYLPRRGHIGIRTLEKSNIWTQSLGWKVHSQWRKLCEQQPGAGKVYD